VGTFGLAAAIAAPWAARNRIVFHEYIPVKSNMYYDVYNANFSDGDGVWDLESMSHHPYSASAERFVYAKEGEIQYVGQFRTAFWKALPARFPEYARKVLNRLLAETVAYPRLYEHDRGLRLLVTRIVYALPFVCTLLALGIGSRHRAFVLACAVFATAYLLPYALIGFYVRYLLPLTPVLIVMCFCGLDSVASALGRTHGKLPR
jgi:hypothetical protein